MRTNKHRLCAILMFGLGLTGLYGQENISASGGEATGSGGSVNWSVGQVTYETKTGTNGSVSEGVQQPYEISVISAIKEAEAISLSVTAYPNPVADQLILTIENIELSSLSIQLCDMQGKILQNEKITGRQTSIAMDNLISATYFVKVIQDNKEIKTFKIIKE